ncbi:MAG: GNAT family N-acetyltransferase [Clostridiaceae bacterium]|nr:GNAT family N-acetyltransferase [Clostridiaceae bacterium]
MTPYKIFNCGNVIYFIDLKYQNRGFGTEALKELLAFMKEKYGARYFTTTYIWGNEQAKRVYMKAGFIETDVVDEDGIHEVNMFIEL